MSEPIQLVLVYPEHVSCQRRCYCCQQQAGLLFTDVIVHGLVVCLSKRVVQREHVADDDIVRWLFEENDGDWDQ